MNNFRLGIKVMFFCKSSFYNGYNLTPLKRFAEKSDTNYETIYSEKMTP